MQSMFLVILGEQNFYDIPIRRIRSFYEMTITKLHHSWYLVELNGVQ